MRFSLVGNGKVCDILSELSISTLRSEVNILSIRSIRSISVKCQRLMLKINSQVPVVNPVNQLLMLEVNPVNPLQIVVVNLVNPLDRQRLIRSIRYNRVRKLVYSSFSLKRSFSR